MCKAVSILITKSKKVYWKGGVDSHDELQTLYVKKDKELKYDVMPPENTFARIEINPKDGNYLNPKQKWVFKIDEAVTPSWLDKSYEKPCYDACKKWQKLVYSRINLKEAIKPIHPFRIKPPKISTRHLKLLAKWDSVGDSVGDSVWASVWDSVRAYNGSLYKELRSGSIVQRLKKKAIHSNPQSNCGRWGLWGQQMELIGTYWVARKQKFSGREQNRI